MVYGLPTKGVDEAWEHNNELKHTNDERKLIFEGKAPLRLAAQNSRPHVPLAPMRSAPTYFLCKWGVYTLLD